MSVDYAIDTQGGATLLAIRRKNVILVLPDRISVAAFRKKVVQVTVQYDLRGKTVLYWDGVQIGFTRAEYEALRSFVREELQ